jgi:large subunit ribosomal protein L23
MALFGNKKIVKGQTAAAPAKKAAAKKGAVKSAEPASMQDLYSETAVAPKNQAAKAGVTQSKANAAYRVLVQPLITEKATNLTAVNKYAFIVSAAANKIEVAKAIAAAYGVKPVKVNLLNVKGKKVARGKVRGQRSDWRKAIVTLPKGQTIKIYEGV